MNRALQQAAVLSGLTLQLLAQTSWQVEGGHTRARVVGPEARAVAPGGCESLPPGAYLVHFPAGEEGKPGTLRLSVAGSAHAVLGAPRLRRAPRRFVDVDVDGVAVTASTWGAVGARPATEARILPTEQRDGRVSARVKRSAGCRAFALLGRSSADGGYLLAVDWREARVRLERRTGADRCVLGEVAVDGLSDELTLTLQVRGFRVEGFVDDARLLQALDGAVIGGAFGVGWSGQRPHLGAVWTAPAAAPLASSAAVHADRATSLYSFTPRSPGSLARLELCLDRPHALIPRARTGFEPWLRQRSAAPVVALGDWRGSLGAGTVCEVGVGGALRADLRWPDLPMLRKQVVLARWRIVAPGGGALVGATPAVRVVF